MNTAKSIGTVLGLALVFIGMPVLFVNVVGIADAKGVLGLTGQESAGILGFVFYIGFIFGWRYLNKKNKPNV